MLPKTEDFQAISNNLRGLTDKAKIKPILHSLLSEAKPEMPHPDRRYVVDKIARHDQWTYCVGVKIRHEDKRTWYEVSLYHIRVIKSLSTLDLLKMVAGTPRCVKVARLPLEIGPDTLPIVTDLRKFSATHDHYREAALSELHRRNEVSSCK